MIIADRLIYLQLQKTGSTFLGTALREGLGAEQRGVHRPLATSEFELASERLIVGSVRDPYDWYVSLWGYSCSGKGEIYDRTAGSAWRHASSVLLRSHEPEVRGLLRELRKDRDVWQRLYADPTDAHAFREWLAMLHSDAGRQAWGPGLSGTDVRADQGLYSHFFRRCFSWRAHPLRRRLFVDKGLPRHGTLAVADFIRLEHVLDDLERVMVRAGYGSDSIQSVREATHGADRNRSDREATDKYWTTESRREIEELDQLIFDTAGYDAWV